MPYSFYNLPYSFLGILVALSILVIVGRALE